MIDMKYLKYIALFSLFFMKFSFAGNTQSNPNSPPPPPPPSPSLGAATTAQNDPNIKTELQNIEKKREDSFNELLNKNFVTYTFPPEYYSRDFSDGNVHLPPVVFYSYVASEAFNYAKNDQVDQMRYFLDNYDFSEVKDDVNQRNILITSVISGSINSMRVILMKKIVDVNDHDAYGKTALHYAVSLGNYDIIRLLLSLGANPHIKDLTGLSSIDFAKSKSPSIQKIMLEYSK